MHDNMSLPNKTNYAELVGLCGMRPIMRKRLNYAQNYARAQSHNSIPLSLIIVHQTERSCQRVAHHRTATVNDSTCLTLLSNVE